MKKNDLIHLLKSLGIQPNKKLGQNFLYDRNILDLLAKVCRENQNDLTIEIGPGIGNFTDMIRTQDTRLIVVEYDRKLAGYLTEKYSDSNISVIHGDACKLNFDQYSMGLPFTCIGNLPYNCSSPILSRLLSAENKPESMCFLFQKEMAERIVSNKDCKSYGAISIKTQALYAAKIVRNIPPNVFWPMPEVQSSFIIFKKIPDAIEPDIFNKLSGLIKLGFSHRRKRLVTNLRSCYSKDFLEKTFLDLNLNLAHRPENLSVKQYVKLTIALNAI